MYVCDYIKLFLCSRNPIFGHSNHAWSQVDKINKSSLTINCFLIISLKVSLNVCIFLPKWSRYPTAYAYQTIKLDLVVHEPELAIVKTLDQLFVKDMTVFCLYPPYYGAKGTVSVFGKPNVSLIG